MARFSAVGADPKSPESMSFGCESPIVVADPLSWAWMRSIAAGSTTRPRMSMGNMVWFFPLCVRAKPGVLTDGWDVTQLHASPNLPAMRTRVRWYVALTLAAVVALAGCGSDEEPAPQGGSSGMPTETGAPSEPAVEPATGPELVADRLTVNLPEDWERSDKYSILTEVGVSTEKNTSGWVSLFFSFAAKDLDAAVAVEQSTDQTKAKELRRLDDTTVAGMPAYHLVDPRKKTQRKEMYGVVHEGRAYSVTFMFDDVIGTPEKENESDEVDDVIASILATARFD